MKKIRILIADDHSIVRTGLRLLLSSSTEFSVVGEASSGEEAIAFVTRQKPDIAIVDISMPTMNGIEATHHIKEINPNTKVIILTIHEDEEYVFQMLRAGASGYILKDAGKNELFAAIRAVNSGDRFFSPGISKMMIDEFVNRAHANGAKPPAQKPLLTKREIEVLKLIAEGLTNPEIASRLYLSARTVDTHRTNLMRKLKIHDIAGLVTYAITRSIMDPKTKS